MNINKVILLGTIAKDIFTETLPSGARVMEFPIKVSETYVFKGEVKESYEHIGVKSYTKANESVLGLARKGDTILVDGKLKTKAREKNNVRYKDYFIVAERLELFPAGEAPPSNFYDNNMGRLASDDDRVPF